MRRLVGAQKCGVKAITVANFRVDRGDKKVTSLPRHSEIRTWEIQGELEMRRTEISVRQVSYIRLVHFCEIPSDK